jgi:hypothetical protein
MHIMCAVAHDVHFVARTDLWTDNHSDGTSRECVSQRRSLEDDMNWFSRSRFPQARPAALAALLITLAIGYGLGLGGFEPVAAVRAAGGAIEGPNVEGFLLFGACTASR